MQFEIPTRDLGHPGHVDTGWSKTRGVGPFLLKNPVQRYAWGSPSAIPQLLGLAADGAPWAELWMGAHPRAPSRIEIAGVARSLNDVIAAHPTTFLGPRYADRGALPFLFKVIAAAQPLSIQCHPDEQQARAGFAREEAAGVPRAAPQRVYPDPTAKPELVVACSTFTGLKGFRPPEEIAGLLSAYGVDLGVAWTGRSEEASIRAYWTRLLTSDPSQRTEWLHTAVRRSKNIDRPESRWLRRLVDLYPGDAGALAPLMLNLVELQPREALFLRPREMHAYLEGTALEVMANSDNVLRGGLTRKHVDVPELLRVLDFAPRRPEPRAATPDGSGWSVFSSPAPQFSLRVGRVQPGHPLSRPPLACMEIVLCLEGHGRVEAEDGAVDVTKGQSVVIPAASGPYRIDGDGEVYLAAVGPATALRVEPPPQLQSA